MSSGEAPDARQRLILPISILIACLFTVAFVVAILEQNLSLVEITAAPFALMCGYVFGVKITRTGYEPENGDEPPPRRRPKRGGS